MNAPHTSAPDRRCTLLSIPCGSLTADALMRNLPSLRPCWTTAPRQSSSHTQQLPFDRTTNEFWNTSLLSLAPRPRCSPPHGRHYTRRAPWLQGRTPRNARPRYTNPKSARMDYLTPVPSRSPVARQRAKCSQNPRTCRPEPSLQSAQASLATA